MFKRAHQLLDQIGQGKLKRHLSNQLSDSQYRQPRDIFRYGVLKLRRAVTESSMVVDGYIVADQKTSPT